MIKTSNNGQFTLPAMPAVGTTVTQSASANTYGSYVQMTAATSEDDYIVGIVVSNALFSTAVVIPEYIALAIGVGSAASEVLVGTACISPRGTYIGSGSTFNVGGVFHFAHPIPVASGARIAVKSASSVATAFQWKVTLLMAKQADLVDAGIPEQSDLTKIKTQAVTCAAGVTVGAFVGNATAALSVNADGRVDVIKVAGTTQTAKDIGSIALTVDGKVTVGTNGDKTGYSLADGSLVTATLGTFALAKGTNITGFNDLTAAQVNAECDTALADYDGPTNTEMDARTIAAADYATAADLATVAGYLDTEIAAIKTKTDFLPSVIAGGAGGLMISGANTGPWSVDGGVTFSNAGGTGLFVSGSTAGFLITGGTAHGLLVTSAAIDAVQFSAFAGNSNALTLLGSGSGDGLSATGGATGRGFHLSGGSTSGAGLRMEARAGNSSGAEFVKNGSGQDMLAELVAANFGTASLNGKGDWNTTAPDNASITAILADTDELQTNQGNWLTATGFAVPGSQMTLDLTQAFTPTDNTETIGGALAAARAQGFGKWVLVGTTLTQYAADGTTAVRVFTLDSATAPTSRV